jgi:hypothetical protein
MLRKIAKLPASVVAFKARGTVSAEDYESQLVPAVEAALKRHKKIRFLYHLGPAFSSFSFGALWDDARVGFGHLGAWERIAVVTDVEWIRLALHTFSFVMPGRIRVFPNRQLAAAKRWIVS